MLVGAGSDVVAVESVPTPAQVNFAVKYVGDPGELDGETEHELLCRVLSPAGEQIAEQRTFLQGQAAMIVPGFLAEIVMPTSVILELQETGAHRFVFGIDGDEHEGIPIHVIPIDELPEAMRPR